MERPVGRRLKTESFSRFPYQPLVFSLFPYTKDDWFV